MIERANRYNDANWLFLRKSNPPSGCSRLADRDNSTRMSAERFGTQSHTIDGPNDLDLRVAVGFTTFGCCKYGKFFDLPAHQLGGLIEHLNPLRNRQP